MLTFPDPNVETEYTDPNGSVWEFNGTGWVRQCDCDGSGGGSGGDGGDTEWADVDLLINVDGEAHGSQNIVDESGNYQLTLVNNTRVSTSELRWGSGSVEFDRTSGSCITVDSAQALGRNEFCVEMWVWLDANRGNNCGIFQYASAPLAVESGSRPGFHLTNPYRLRVYGWSSNFDTGVNLTPETWTHLALTRDSTDMMRVFVDGQIIHEAVDATDFTNTGLMIGRLYNKDFYGFMDDIRISIGNPRYTQDFSSDLPQKHPVGQARKLPKIITVDLPEIQDDSNDSEPLGDNQ